MRSTDWDERYSTHELVWGAEPNQFVRQQCERLPVGRALDLACGEGRNALWLARLGWQVHGSDFSPVAIDRARELTDRESDAVRERVTWEVADISTSSLPRQRYDLVLISYLHLGAEHRDRLMAEASGAVRPGGRFLLVAHDRRNISEGVGGPQDASLLTTPAEVAAGMRAGGLAVEFAETVRRQTTDGIALDTLALAIRPPGSLSSTDL
jgi:SAM-dependent methyltransferase